MILKLKAKIFQYTGIFLAQKEQEKALKHNSTPSTKAHWQLEHGFVSFLPNRKFVLTRSPLKDKIKWRLGIIWLQLKHDLRLK